jgi:predicted nucleic acid-binding protein
VSALVARELIELAEREDRYELAREPETTFIDTNLLLYAHDATETAKQPVARAALEELWRDRSGALSTQVLQEFYVVATRKLSKPLMRDEAREVVASYSAWPVVIIDPTLILAARQIEEEHQLSFWDALVIEAARIRGAQRLLTEDLQDGRVIEGIRIENPFTNVAERGDAWPDQGRRLDAARDPVGRPIRASR